MYVGVICLIFGKWNVIKILRAKNDKKEKEKSYAMAGKAIIQY